MKNMDAILERVQQLESLAQDLCSVIKKEMGMDSESSPASEDEYADSGDDGEEDNPSEPIMNTQEDEEAPASPPRKDRAALVIQLLGKKYAKRK